MSASGFDALNPADTGDENSSQAGNVLDGHRQGWSTQYYDSAHFGSLKSGTGFILNLGEPAKVSSVTVKFGQATGAIAELKVGNSAVRSSANLSAMTPVAGPVSVAGSYTFTIQHPVFGQVPSYLVHQTATPGWSARQVRGADLQGHHHRNQLSAGAGTRCQGACSGLTIMALRACPTRLSPFPSRWFMPRYG